MSDRKEFTIEDKETGAVMTVGVETDNNGLLLYPKGYSTATEEEGAPLLLDFHDGKLSLKVWGDIEKDDPTHDIDLSGCKEFTSTLGLDTFSNPRRIVVEPDYNAVLSTIKKNIADVEVLKELADGYREAALEGRDIAPPEKWEADGIYQIVADKLGELRKSAKEVEEYLAAASAEPSATTMQKRRDR